MFFILYSNDLIMKNVYNMSTKRWLIETEGIYFTIKQDWYGYYDLHYYERIENSKLIVTEENYEELGRYGEIGTALYSYDYK